MSGCEPIEAYLDAQLLELRGSPRAARHVLREVEAHLLDATNEGVDEGLTEDEAARRAVERFGPPALVARQLARASGSVGLVTLVRDAVVSLLPVGAVFLVAIGLSGLVAGGLGLAVGKDFVAGDPPGVTYGNLAPRRRPRITSVRSSGTAWRRASSALSSSQRGPSGAAGRATASVPGRSAGRSR